MSQDQPQLKSNNIFWLKQGSIAITDQALFAGTNFILNILLARWLSLKEYGAFTIAFSIFVLIGTFHTAILTEPMTVFASGKYEGSFRKYLAAMIYLHWGVCVVLCAVLALGIICVNMLDGPEMNQALMGLLIASPFIYLLWIFRRSFYILIHPQWAAVGGFLYLIILLCQAFLLLHFNLINSLTAFIAMGAAALLVSAGLLLKLRPRWKLDDGNPSLSMIINDHWIYGRWALGAAVLMWLPANLYYFILPHWIGLEGTAALRALMNLVMPSLNVFTALSMVMLPVMSKRFSKDGIEGVHSIVKQMLIYFVVFSGIYWLGIGIINKPVFYLLYGGKYMDQSSLIWIAALLPLFSSIIAVFGSGIRAFQRADNIFWSYLLSAITCFAVGIPLIMFFKIVGALIGILVSYCITSLAMIFLYWRFSRHESH